MIVIDSPTWFFALTFALMLPVAVLFAYYDLAKRIWPTRTRKWYFPLLEYGLLQPAYYIVLGVMSWLTGRTLLQYAAQVVGVIIASIGLAGLVAVYALYRRLRHRKLGTTDNKESFL